MPVPISRYHIPVPTRIDIDHGGIFIIESVSEGHTGRRLFEDIAPMCEQRQYLYGLPDLNCRLEQPETRAELFSALRSIPAGGWIPILHIEAHSLPEGLVTANDELILWSELYSDFQNLNVACRNNLMVVLAACDGISAAEVFLKGLLQPAPVRFVLGPERDEDGNGPLESDLERGFRAFYTAILQRNDVFGGCVELKNCVSHMRMVAAERIFALGLNNYFAHHASRRTISARVEAIVTEGRKIDPEWSAADLRRYAKERIRNIDFDHYKNRVFMIDQYPELADKFSHVVCEKG